MPLSRPFGDPFGRTDEEDEELTKKPAKTRVPITSSAFSFKLGTSHSTPNRTPATQTVKSEKIGRLATPQYRQSTPVSKLGDITPGPSRPSRPLQALPSPFRIGGSVTPTVKIENGSRVTDLALGSAKALGKRKALDDDERGEGSEAGSPARKTMQALGQLGRIELGQSLHVDELKKRVEEEGIGVSPRGKRIVKYSGKGPPPLSIVLHNALSSQQSSLVLFYASLQSTLYPTRTPKKSRMTPSALTEGALKPIPKGPTVLQHLRTAPLVLSAVDLVPGRTGWSVMCRCKVLKGEASSPSLGSRTKPSEGSTSTLHDGPANDDEAKTGDMIEARQGGHVLVVLQPLPSDCVKVGLDARMITLKPPSALTNATYEIGIWPPWSDTAYTSELADDKNDTSSTTLDTTVQQQVVFASRYLIATTDAAPHSL